MKERAERKKDEERGKDDSIRKVERWMGCCKRGRGRREEKRKRERQRKRKEKRGRARG